MDMQDKIQKEKAKEEAEVKEKEKGKENDESSGDQERVPRDHSRGQGATSSILQVKNNQAFRRQQRGKETLGRSSGRTNLRLRGSPQRRRRKLIVLEKIVTIVGRPKKEKEWEVDQPLLQPRKQRTSRTTKRGRRRARQHRCLPKHNVTRKVASRWCILPKPKRKPEKMKSNG